MGASASQCESRTNSNAREKKGRVAHDGQLASATCGSTSVTVLPRKGVNSASQASVTNSGDRQVGGCLGRLGGLGGLLFARQLRGGGRRVNGQYLRQQPPLHQAQAGQLPAVIDQVVASLELAPQLVRRRGLLGLHRKELGHQEISVPGRALPGAWALSTANESRPVASLLPSTPTANDRALAGWDSRRGGASAPSLRKALVASATGQAAQVCSAMSRRPSSINWLVSGLASRRENLWSGARNACTSRAAAKLARGLPTSSLGMRQGWDCQGTGSG